MAELSPNGSSYKLGSSGMTSIASRAVTYSSLCSVPRSCATDLAYPAS